MVCPTLFIAYLLLLVNCARGIHYYRQFLQLLQVVEGLNHRVDVIAVE